MIEEILIELGQMQDFTEQAMPDDPYSLAQHQNILSVYLARLGKIIVDSKRLLITKQNEVRHDYPMEFKTFALTKYNMFVKQFTELEETAVEWAEKIDRVIGYQIKCSITQISFAKSEMQINNYTSNK